jgi:hypothetical protein
MHGGDGGQLGILVAAWLQLGVSTVSSVAALRRKAQWQRSGGSGSGVSAAVAAAAWQRRWQHGVGVGGWHLQKRSGSIVASVVETRTTIKMKPMTMVATVVAVQQQQNCGGNVVVSLVAAPVLAALRRSWRHCGSGRGSAVVAAAAR